MPKRWSDDPTLVEGLSQQLVTAMAMFPKHLIHLDQLVHRFHMPVSHMQILALIERRELSIGELSTQLGVAKPNITPLVDTLSERGFTERFRDSQDKRIVQVRLLPAGRRCLDEIRAAVAEQITQWPHDFTKAEVRQLSTSLASLIDVMDIVGKKD